MGGSSNENNPLERFSGINLEGSFQMKVLKFLFLFACSIFNVFSLFHAFKYGILESFWLLSVSAFLGFIVGVNSDFFLKDAKK